MTKSITHLLPKPEANDAEQITRLLSLVRSTEVFQKSTNWPTDFEDSPSVKNIDINLYIRSSDNIHMNNIYTWTVLGMNDGHAGRGSKKDFIISGVWVEPRPPHLCALCM